MGHIVRNGETICAARALNRGYLNGGK